MSRSRPSTSSEEGIELHEANRELAASKNSGQHEPIATDFDTLAAAQAQMNGAALEICKMSSDVADARTVREFSSDRLKRAFSVTTAEFLEAGDSAAAAEHKARASKVYGAALHDLGEDYKTAMRIIERLEALKCSFESARSILSCERAKIGLL